MAVGDLLVLCLAVSLFFVVPGLVARGFVRLLERRGDRKQTTTREPPQHPSSSAARVTPAVVVPTDGDSFSVGASDAAPPRVGGAERSWCLTRTALLLDAAVNVGDVATARSLFAPGVTHEDHRVVTSSRPGIGCSAPLEELLTLAGSGHGGISSALVATRGDDLALVHLHPRRDTGATNGWLQVIELDDRGKVGHVVSYDMTDHVAAFAELERRAASRLESTPAEASIRPPVDAQR